MRKILILTHNYPTSSKERRNAGIFVHNFAKELIQQGLEVYIFCPSASKNPGRIVGVPVYWFSWGKKGKSLKDLKVWNPFDLVSVLMFFYRGIKESLSFAQEIKPDYCLSMWAIPSGVLAWVIKKKLNIPYGIWSLGSDIYVYSRLPVLGGVINNVLRAANHRFSDGYDMLRKVRRITGKKCFFLPSGTSFSHSLPLNNKRKDRRYTVLSFVGRIEREKGPDIFVDALLKLESGFYQKLRVNVIGDGSLLHGLKEKINVQGLGPFVKFYGNIDSQAKIFSILQNSDWLVIPSRSDSIPLVFSESMKAKVPVIVAALPDLKYLIEKYKVGLYFRPGDIEGLSRVFANLPSQRYKDIMVRNTSKVAQMFKLETSALKFLSIIQ